MDWLKSLELPDLIGLIGLPIALIGVIYAVKAYNQGRSTPTPIIDQKSNGDQSPVINTKGKVEINYHSLSKEQFNGLLARLNTQSGDKKHNERLLSNLLDQVDTHKLKISDLEQLVEELKAKIEDILADDSITEAVKALVAGGKLEEAEALVDRQYEEELKEADLLLAAKHFERGRIKDLRLKYREAFSAYEKAAHLQPGNADYLHTAGLMAHTLADYDKAIEYLELALASDLKTYGEDHPDVARDRGSLGSAWHSLGEYEKAIGLYELALASDLKTFGEDSPFVTGHRNGLGSAWDSLGDYEKAIGLYELALASDLKNFGEDHPNVANRRNGLGLAWKSLGEHEKAIGLLELAFNTCKASLGEEHPNTRLVQKNLDAVIAEKA